MQDNFDKAFRDKLAGYQAPADPMDWAAMSAALDAQESKRRGFFWWWVLGLGLIATTGTISYHLWSSGNGSHNSTANAASGQLATTNNSATEQGNSTGMGSGNNAHNNTDADAVNADNTQENGTANSNQPNGNNIAAAHDADKSNVSANGGAAGNSVTVPNATGNNGGVSSNIASGSKPSKGNKGSKKAKANPTAANTAASATGGSVTKVSNTGKQGKSNTRNANGSNNPSSNNIDGATGANNTDASQGYEDLSATISIKQLKQLPNDMDLAIKKDTSDISYKMLKPKAISHYIGFGGGWLTSRVDRSGDFRPGYNVGLQYGMMVKNRIGLNVGLAFRQYNYFTDLVACNYEIYQCPTNYSSELRTVDLNVGVQVNLVKTEKVDWYVIGGVNNQFMLEETFTYDLPVVDTPSVPNLPVEPPRNTSFTGGGASDFSESISNSFDATVITAGATGEGKFLRERYLGAWYVGTGVTYRFVPRMSLQVEPVIGRTFQFVGLQDKKLWNAGVNVRFNVRLGR